MDLWLDPQLAEKLEMGWVHSLEPWKDSLMDFWLDPQLAEKLEME